jgi:hypothetical protein
MRHGAEARQRPRGKVRVKELAEEQEQTHNWQNTRRHARSPIRPAEWPPGIQAISLEGLALLGIDDQNRLYWDGKRLATLTLTAWQKTAAVIVTASAALAAIAAIASAAADWYRLGFFAR